MQQAEAGRRRARRAPRRTPMSPRSRSTFWHGQDERRSPCVIMPATASPEPSRGGAAKLEQEDQDPGHDDEQRPAVLGEIESDDALERGRAGRGRRAWPRRPSRRGCTAAHLGGPDARRGPHRPRSPSPSRTRRGSAGPDSEVIARVSPWRARPACSRPRRARPGCGSQPELAQDVARRGCAPCAR